MPDLPEEMKAPMAVTKSAKKKRENVVEKEGWPVANPDMPEALEAHGHAGFPDDEPLNQ